MMERLDFYESWVKALEGEKAALEKLVVVAQSAMKDALDHVAQYSTQLEAMDSELSAAKVEVNNLKAEVEE